MLLTNYGVAWFEGGELNYKLEKLPTHKQVEQLLAVLNRAAKECQKIIEG